MTGIGVGNHTIYAQWGAGSIVSSTINIVVNPPPTSISLSVNSTSFTMPASIIMTANASVNGYGSVGSVAFYADGNLLFTSYSSPYQYTWSGATPGNHSLTATVYNTDGATSSTPSINVAVYMPPNFVAFNNQCSKK